MLLLAGCVAMGDRETEAIRRFVASGGRLCVVGPLATHDQWMLPRPKPALDDLPDAAVVRVDEQGDWWAAVRQACGETLSMSIGNARGTDAGEAPDGLCAELTEQSDRRLVHLVNYRDDGPIRDLAVAVQLPPGNPGNGRPLGQPGASGRPAAGTCDRGRRRAIHGAARSPPTRSPWSTLREPRRATGRRQAG